jgi:hypothetical protein
MAGTDDLEASAAWQAIPRSLRKVYAAITTEIAAQGGTEGRITYEDFQDGHGTSPPASALRTLRI